MGRWPLEICVCVCWGGVLGLSRVLLASFSWSVCVLEGTRGRGRNTVFEREEICHLASWVQCPWLNWSALLTWSASSWHPCATENQDRVEFLYTREADRCQASDGLLVVGPSAGDPECDHWQQVDKDHFLRRVLSTANSQHLRAKSVHRPQAGADEGQKSWVYPTKKKGTIRLLRSS